MKLTLECNGKYRAIKRLEKFINWYIRDHNSQIDDYSLKTRITLLDRKEKNNERSDTHNWDS